MQENQGPDFRPKPGDRIYRVPRIRPLRIIVPRLRPRRPVVGVSLLTLVYGFAIVITAGSLLLMLPVFTNSGLWTPYIDALFTTTSAVCVTGLVVVDTLDHWNFWGQLVILVMIQLGGLGFMTSATILLIAAGRRIGLRGRILIGESTGLPHIGGIVRLTRNIVYFSLLTEAVGALILYSRFSGEYGPQLGAWMSVFQSISAFNNAGFDLFGGFQSLIGYNTDYLVILPTAALIILGSISFAALHNIFSSRSLRRSSVDTKLVFQITLMILGIGTVVILATEFNNPQTLAPLSLPHKILNAFFYSVTRTAGFDTVLTGSMATYTLFFIIVLMFIGGATGSTAGGIKVNTFGLIMATVWNTIRGKEYPGAFHREFPFQQVFRAITVLILALIIIAVVFFILSIWEEFSSIEILFETVSAFGTVGLTNGITPGLSIFGRIVIIITMFIGRLGPLTLSMALTRAQRITDYRYPQESVRIG